MLLYGIIKISPNNGDLTKKYRLKGFDSMKELQRKINDFIEKHLNKGGRRNLWLTIILIAFVMIWMTLFDNMMYKLNTPEEVTTAEFLESLEAGDIDTIYYNASSEMMRYTLLNDETRNMSAEERAAYSYDNSDWRMTLYLGGENFRYNMLTQYNVRLKVQTFSPTLSEFWSLLFSFGLLIGICIFVLYLLQTGTANQKKFDSMEGRIDTTFKDVIGQDEVLEDLNFIVKMMRGEKLDALGARIPKGVLLSGPPGTGKTLIARAVAGEAGVPFFSANASGFIDMYVGVGAKTVRTLFKQARKRKPCVIFIDEIDAIASVRGAQGTTSEDNKTVNALLQEMDGFNKESGIFVIAATNNPDLLDPAIVRAGRFDRQVVVNPPRDWTVRKKMFDLYVGETACEADIENIAKQTVGFTGADINAVVNEAKLVAAMQNKLALDAECFETAIDKKVFKANRSSSERHKRDIEIAAYHEAGHAIMTHLAGLPIARASIIGSTSGVGGVVFQAEKDTSQFSTKDEYEWQIRICYAGRASELIQFNKITNGASSDITQATKLIYAYVCKFGMSEDYGLLDTDILKTISPFAVPNEIMQDLSKKFMKEAEGLLRNNYKLVEAIAIELLEKETMPGDIIADKIKQLI